MLTQKECLQYPIIGILIPVRDNEARNLGYAFKIHSIAYEVILVDETSKDGSTTMAERLLPTFPLVKQIGKGYAIKSDDAAYGNSITLNGNESVGPNEILRFVEIMAGNDLAKDPCFGRGRKS